MDSRLAIACTDIALVSNNIDGNGTNGRRAQIVTTAKNLCLIEPLALNVGISDINNHSGTITSSIIAIISHNNTGE